MVNQQVLQGNWNELKGKLRDKWGQLTDDDVARFDGNVDQLVGMIQRKTGEGREQIERILGDMTSSGSNSLNQAAEAAKQYANRAAKAIEEQFPQAGEQIRQGYEQASRRAQETYEEYSRRMQETYQQAEETVRSHPFESLAVMFAAGVVTGLCVGAMLRSR
jgi:uncharacterized protein YjbJ (UPF0337 family)